MKRRNNVNKSMMIATAVLIACCVIFAYGCLFYPHDPMLVTGASLEKPSSVHFLGTDDLGSDIFSQISSGFYNSMIIGLFAALISFFLGGLVGVTSGYFGGRVDTVLSFVINFFLSVPQLPIMIVVGAFFGQSVANIIIIVSAFSWARIAKIVRSKVNAISDNGYLKISKDYGGGIIYICKTHILADVLPILTVNSIDVIGKAVIQEASLAFLGLSDPSSHSWGLMIDKAISFQGIYFTDYWKWWLMSPLLCLVLTIFCIRIIARELEKRLVY